MRLSVLRLAGRNLARQPARSLIVLAAFALIAGTLFGLSVMLRSAGRGVERGMARLGADVMVVPAAAETRARGLLLSGTPSSFVLPAEALRRLRSFPGVSQSTTQLFLVSAELSCCSVGNTLLIAFDPESDFTITPWLEQAGRGPVGPDEVIIGSRIEFLPGTTARFYGHPFRVAGRLDATGVDFVDRAVFVPREGARRMIENSARDAEVPLRVDPDAVSAVLFRADGMTPAELAIRIEAAVPGVRALMADELARNLRRGLGVSVRAIALSSALEWLVMLALVGVVYSVSLAERRRELGVLRALGARRGQLVRLLLLEVAGLAAADGALGIAAAGTVVVLFERLIRLAWNVPWLRPGAGELLLLAGATLLAVGAAATLSVVGPVLRVARRDPYDAIRAGE